MSDAEQEIAFTRMQDASRDDYLKIGAHALGGPAAHRLTGQINSDIADGKLVADAPKAQLYDLSTDPYQAKNLYRERPEVAAQMRALLDEYCTSPRTAPKNR